jgi:hypothetical protein
MQINISYFEYCGKKITNGLNETQLFLLYISYFLDSKIFTKERALARLNNLRKFGVKYFEPKNHSSKFKHTHRHQNILDVFDTIAQSKNETNTFNVLTLLKVIQLFYNVSKKETIKIFINDFKNSITYAYQYYDEICKLYYLFKELDNTKLYEKSYNDFDYTEDLIESYKFQEFSEAFKRLFPTEPNIENDFLKVFSNF